MKKITIQLPSLTVSADLYKEELLPLIEMLILKEINTPEWQNKFHDMAQEIYKNAIAKYQPIDPEALKKADEIMGGLLK